MISKHSHIDLKDLKITRPPSNSLLEATEWTMMIAVWVKKGVFH